MADDLGRSFVSFFAIIDPIGNVIVFYLLTQQLLPQRRLLVAAISVAMAAALLVVFALAGQQVLDLLSISEESFKVAAGLLLLFPAYRLVEHGQPMEAAGADEVDPIQIALVPLATPLMAGPGALATAISFSETLGRGTTLGGLGLVLAVSFAMFALAAQVLRWLGQSVMRLLARLVGIVLFAIAVNLILEGLNAYFD
ncbi:MAG TPA: MarC family protein [Dehalococcoidia bacterium]|nr:MarC family protein [Dehalococcoidia bacterium]